MGWAIALHGGAGVIARSLPDDQRLPREATLRRSLDLGVFALRSNRCALDVVELVVRELENCPYFNAGVGSVLTTDGTVEMEACIMDCNKKCGAVSGLSTVVNAISVARLVMEKTPHIYLAFDGAEAFAREQLDYTPPTDGSLQSNHVDAEANGGTQTGTVGCVAIDSSGYFAAATSTGGLVNKMVGRIGDTPIIGSGTYANCFCAVSATGKGESIMRHTVARDVAALMEYKGLSLHEAAARVVEEAPKGDVGLVAVSATGEISMNFNTVGMFRACATEDGYSEVSIW